VGEGDEDEDEDNEDGRQCVDDSVGDLEFR
jgi:hypothetical protein